MKSPFSLLAFSRYWYWLCLALLLGYTFRLYGFAYFWTDDFNVLYYAQLTNTNQAWGNLIDPTFQSIRPVGWDLYWLLFRWFDLDPLPYHVVAWGIHAVNTALVYVILRRVVRSSFSAAIGAAFFASQAVFSDIYTTFGDIYELCVTLFFLASVYVQTSRKPSIQSILALLFLFLLAMKSKEMAITLPVLLGLASVIQPAKLKWDATVRPMVVSLIAPALMVLPSLWYLHVKTVDDAISDPTYPYYMNFSFRELARGYAWYLDRLFVTELNWIWYLIAAVVILGVAAWYRQRAALFFVLLTGLTFAPVIPLVNHRFEFYWYLPLVGMAGLLAVGVKAVSRWIDARVPATAALIAGIVIFPLFCRQIYFRQKSQSAPLRSYYASGMQDARTFVTVLRALPPLPPDSAIYFSFTSPPTPLADPVWLMSVSQVALHRTDVRAKLVEHFPPEAKYRLTFDDRLRLSPVSWPR